MCAGNKHKGQEAVHLRLMSIHKTIGPILELVYLNKAHTSRSGRRPIDVKEEGNTEGGFKSLMRGRRDNLRYGLLRPHSCLNPAHTHQNIKDLVDVFPSDLDAVYLQYFVSL